MERAVKVALYCLVVMMLVSCGSDKKEQPAPVEQQGSKQYICPMKCSSVPVNEPGKCPKCNMDLEEVSPG